VILRHIVHAQAHKPAKQQVVVDLLDQKALGTDGKNTCSNSKARRMYSGAIDRRPESACSASNSACNAIGSAVNRAVFVHTALRAFTGFRHCWSRVHEFSCVHPGEPALIEADPEPR
jgi:hypothetical protein